MRTTLGHPDEINVHFEEGQADVADSPPLLPHSLKAIPAENARNEEMMFDTVR